MELLAPAGTPEAFFVALEEGADAVYVGAPGANARALTRDFTLEEIAWMCRYAHQRKKKIHVAMNALVKQEELRTAVATLSVLADQIRPDALIVQDMGLWHIARTWFPSLTLHASTLMSVHNTAGAAAVESRGIDRVVLARELSLQEIREISRNTNVELEVFIHGAMCYSYSGLCLFSSLHGGKSSLRGQCVQPCRRRYSLQPSRRTRSSTGRGKSGYYFSMNDLGAIQYLRQLCMTHVVSLKIEGRLRPVEYVRHTVRAYRLCLDNLHTTGEEKKKIERQANRLLDRAMGRYRCGGYLGKKLHQVVTPHQTGGSGSFLGLCSQLRGKERQGSETKVSLVLKKGVHVGDRLRYQDEKRDIRQSFTLKQLWVQGRSVRQAEKGQAVTLRLGEKIQVQKGRPASGALFKVDVKGRGKKKGRTVPANTQAVLNLQAAQSAAQPVLAALSWNKSADIYRSSRQDSPSRRVDWWYRLGTLPPVQQRFPTAVHGLLLPVNQTNVEQVLQLGKRAHQMYPRLVWTLPPVVLETSVAQYARWLQQLQQMGWTAFQLGMMTQISLFEDFVRQDRPLSLFADYSWNVLNSAALLHGREMGLAGMLFSLETDRETLRRTLLAWRTIESAGQERTGHLRVGMYVYGYPALFTSRVPVTEARRRQRITSPKGEEFFVERTQELTMVRARKPFSLLHAVPHLMEDTVDYVVIDLECTTASVECAQVSRLLKKDADTQSSMAGNYYNGLL